MWWGIALLAIPVGVLLALALWVMQKCGVYKIEGPPDLPEDPAELSGEGLYVGIGHLDLDEYGRPPATRGYR
tara:strand:+ start:155 stop:370 length:216 start_codon:yes stop_codon:yes gene_type:complete